MANIDILGLPVAVSIDGTEWSPLVQGDTTKRVQTGLYMAGSGSSSVQDANTFLGGPTSGAAAVPSFRALVSADIQSALDGLSSSQGAVLYRGASDWAALAPSTSGYVLTTQGAGANPQWVANGTGTVSSVALSLPVSVFSVSGSPVTSSGTLTGSFTTQTANTAFLGPTSGGAATPAFRALVAADLPQGTSGYALIGNGASAPSYQGFLQPAAGAVTRTWQAKVQERVSVADFGAVGNGVTDDTAAFTAAIAAAASIGGGIITLGPGTFRITSTVTIADDDIVIEGMGPYQSIIYRDFATGPTILYQKSASAVVRAGGIRQVSFGRNTAQALASSNVAQVCLIAVEAFVIEDVLGYDIVEGVQIIGGHQISINRTEWSGDYSATDKARFGIKGEILVGGGLGSTALPTHVWITNTWISGPDVNGFGYPLWIKAAETWGIANSYFGQGKFFNVLFEQGSDNAGIIDVRVVNGYIDGADRGTGYGFGVYVTGSGVASGATWTGVARTGGDGSNVIQNIHFANSTIKGQSADGQDGIYVDGTARGGTYAQACVGLKISACTVVGWYRNGINLNGGVATIVTGCGVNGNNYTNSGSGDGIVVGANTVRTVLTGNRIGGNAFGGSTSAYQVNGINIVSGATAYMITCNSVSLNTVGVLQSSTDGVAFENWDGSAIAVSEANSLVYLGQKANGGNPVMLLRRAGSTQANYMEVIAANAGSGVRVVASGSDTNITLQMEPKGSGALSVPSNNVVVGQSGTGSARLDVKGPADNTDTLIVRPQTAGKFYTIKPEATTDQVVTGYWLGSGWGEIYNQGTLKADTVVCASSLRINATPAAVGTGAKTISNGADSSTNFGHYLALNMNGTTYYVPCSAVAPT